MRINYNCPDELLAKVDARAKELNMNRSAFMNFALSRQLESDEFSKNIPLMMSTFNRMIDESEKIRKESKKK